MTLKNTRPHEGKSWGSQIGTPSELQTLAFPFDAVCYANDRHQITVHLHHVTDAKEHGAFLEGVLKKAESASGQTLPSDGSLMVRMSEQDFRQQFGGKVAHMENGMVL